MKTLTEYDVQNVATRQISNRLHVASVSHLKDKEDEFDHGLKRAISGDELINRLSIRIHKMFENENTLSSGG